MPHEEELAALKAELAALNAKVDGLTGLVREFQKAQASMQSKFDASGGAFALVRFMAWIAGIGAAIWVAIKTGAR